MIQPAPPGVGTEGVVGLVGQRGAVLVSPPHVLRDVHPGVVPQHDPVAPVLPSYPVWLQAFQSDLET